MGVLGILLGIPLDLDMLGKTRDEVNSGDDGDCKLNAECEALVSASPMMGIGGICSETPG